MGIYDYGDSAEVQVPDDGSDVWVDMMVHPMGDAFYCQLTNGGKDIGIWDSSSGTVTSQEVSATALTPSPFDKVFYSSDSNLYYFNQTANNLYQWGDINKQGFPAIGL